MVRLNSDLQAFVEGMEIQTRVLNSFDMSMEIEHGMIVVRQAGSQDFYVHVGLTRSIAIGALSWHFSRAIHNEEMCWSILEYLRGVVVFEEDER